MEYIKAVNAAEAFMFVSEQVLNAPVRSPRGLATKDMGYTVIELMSPYDALPFGLRTRLSSHIGAVEAIQLIGGFAAPSLMVAAAPNFINYREDDGEFWGAYGSRINVQMQHVMRKLLADGDTRQAVVTLWNPERDNTAGKRDYPCTVSLQFEIVNNRINMTATMRSNDIWLGLPYDMFQFTQLLITLSNVMLIPVGVYRHVAWSMHAYEKHWELLDDVKHGTFSDRNQPSGICASRVATYSDVRRIARGLTYGNIEPADESEAWYENRLKALVDKATKDTKARRRDFSV